MTVSFRFLLLSVFSLFLVCVNVVVVVVVVSVLLALNYDSVYFLRERERGKRRKAFEESVNEMVLCDILIQWTSTTTTTKNKKVNKKRVTKSHNSFINNNFLFLIT